MAVRVNHNSIRGKSGLGAFKLIKSGEKFIKPMGSEFVMTSNPKFRVRALGSHKQLPGCSSEGPLNSTFIDNLCNGECFNPSDERNNITRIEVVRIRPQTYPNEPIETLIEDPWLVLPCEPSQEGCEVEFGDSKYSDASREIIYYVRAIQEPSFAIGAANLACERDESGKCITVNLCGDAEGQGEGDCLAVNEERAWSSPIFVKSSLDLP